MLDLFLGNSRGLHHGQSDAAAGGKTKKRESSLIAMRSSANSGFLGSRVVLGQYKVVVLFL